MPKRVSRWQLIEQTRPCACEGIMVNCFQHNMIWPIRIVISVPLLLLFTLDQQGNPLAPVSEQSTILWLCFLSQWITCNLPLALSKTSRVTWEHVKNHTVFFLAKFIGLEWKEGLPFQWRWALFPWAQWAVVQLWRGSDIRAMLGWASEHHTRVEIGFGEVVELL